MASSAGGMRPFIENRKHSSSRWAKVSTRWFFAMNAG